MNRRLIELIVNDHWCELMLNVEEFLIEVRYENVV